MGDERHTWNMGDGRQTCMHVCMYVSIQAHAHHGTCRGGERHANLGDERHTGNIYSCTHRSFQCCQTAICAEEDNAVGIIEIV